MLEIWLGYYPQMIALVLARVAAVFMVFDFVGFGSVSATFRAAIALVVTIALMPMVPAEWMVTARSLDTMPMLLLAMLGELLLGAAIGLVCQVFLGACRMAGYVAGFSNSLLMAQTVDPMSGRSSAITSDVFRMTFLLLFFLTNGHVVLIHILAGSFGDVPVFSAAGAVESFGGMILLGSSIFAWGLKLAMPILCVAMLIDVSMGLVNKLAPEFEILFLSLPIRLILGLGALGMVIAFSGDIFAAMMKEMFQWMTGLFGIRVVI